MSASGASQTFVPMAAPDSTRSLATSAFRRGFDQPPNAQVDSKERLGRLAKAVRRKSDMRPVKCGIDQWRCSSRRPEVDASLPGY